MSSHGGSCEADATAIWEQAYARFETPRQERSKFRKRLLRLGAQQWPKTECIGEMFCGRGNGLHALSELGFTDISGIDLSPSLLAQYHGSARTYVADCRDTGLPAQKFDRLIVQGGLHHLAVLPGDLAQTLNEFSRLLKPQGHVVAWEPWLTPFLKLVHGSLRFPFIRRAWGKLDALAVMIEHEAETYYNWLGHADQIESLLRESFEVILLHKRFGKLIFIGKKRSSPG